ncbi:hypothetical protein QJS66_05585 [Kocuria rhizophila]|nr:hypothetical protein QJS66_05585 [Kocuria rhizophila]
MLTDPDGGGALADRRGAAGAREPDPVVGRLRGRGRVRLPAGGRRSPETLRGDRDRRRDDHHLLHHLRPARPGARQGLIRDHRDPRRGHPIPSQLTTPEAPHVHSLLALMRERVSRPPP